MYDSSSGWHLPVRTILYLHELIELNNVVLEF